MKFYNFDKNGKFLYASVAQLDPLATKQKKKNVYLTPANSTDVEPPEIKAGFDLFFTGGAWEYKPTPTPEKPKPRELTEREKIQMQIAEQESYLYSTDYKIIKAFETGAQPEAEIVAARAAARAKINELQAALNEND